MKPRKVLVKALASPNNLRFADFVTLVEGFGFTLSRINGSHHIFTHPEVSKLVNLQEVDGKVKPYQVRQFLKLVELYNLQLGDNE